jgi:hypothetical protein
VDAALDLSHSRRARLPADRREPPRRRRDISFAVFPIRRHAFFEQAIFRGQFGYDFFSGLTSLDTGPWPWSMGRDSGSATDLRQHLAAEKFNAGKNVILLHPGPAHPHGEMVYSGSVLRDQNIDDAGGCAHG